MGDQERVEALDDEELLQAGAEAYVSLLGRIRAGDLGELGGLVSEGVRFKDPFNEVRGREQFLGVFRKMFHDLSEVTFEIHDWVRSGRTVYLHWSMGFKARALGRFAPRWAVDGMSRLVLDGEGRVAEHVDHWDTGSQLYGKIPLLNLPIKLMERFV